MRKIECISSDTQNILVDPLDFNVSDLEMRVIRNISESGFLLPYPLDYNNSPALFYTTGDYLKLKEALSRMDMDEWKEAILGLFSIIDIICKNGFLNICNLCLDLEYIFFDSETKRLIFLYLPLSEAYFFVDMKEFTNGLRLFIRVSGESIGMLDSKIRAILADANSDIDRLYNAVKSYIPLQNNSYEPEKRKVGFFSGFGMKKTGTTKNNNSDSSSPIIRVQGGATEILDDDQLGISLVYLGEKDSLKIDIKNSECVLGKQKESVDFVIPYSKAVSRVHCKVGFENGEAHIEDLDSSNGTFVNGSRLDKGEVVTIKEGDIIKLANVEFKVEEIKS